MKVTTIGSAMIDSIAIVASERIERMAMRNAETSFLLLEEGKKIEADAISTHCGGGAVNAAVAYARLGHDVAALVKLGQDDRAEQVLRRLADERVSTRFAHRDARAPTGASVLLSAHDRNAAVFAFRGANTLLEPADLVDAAFAVDLVHVASLSNRSADCFAPILQKARSGGARVAVNPGIRQLSLQAGGFLDLLALIDVLSINRTEADALVPALVARCGEGGALLSAEGGELPALARRGFHGGGYDLSMARFFTALRDLGVGHVIVTDGAAGAYAGGAHGLVHCPAQKGPVAGTAGAGDAFVSTFAASLAEGRDVAVALQRASLNASSVIRYPDTQSGLLTAPALDARLAEDGDKLTVRRWSL
jgi:ribokinase